MQIAPKNWREFQHYKDRSPPWIRLHRKLLDNRDFHSLPVASRALAPMLWLIASESVDGVIDADPGNLAFRLRMREAEVSDALLPLLERGFFVSVHGDIKALAERLRDAEPETEAEREGETEALQTFGQPPRGGRPATKKPPAPSSLAWEAYRTAYRDRYGVDPVRNAQVNAQMAQVVGKLGEAEAPQVAAFFVTLDVQFYVNAGHSVGALLRDAEKVRMQWATGRRQAPAPRRHGAPLNDAERDAANAQSTAEGAARLFGKQGEIIDA